MKMPVVLCLVILLPTLPNHPGLHAQPFSVSEAETIAEFLYLDNVLSEVGKEELKFAVREGGLYLPSRAPVLCTKSRPSGVIYADQILTFLSRVYQSAYAHRRGMGIHFEVLFEHYEVLMTLASLRTLKLIPEATYRTELAELRQNGLVPDFYLLEKLAEAAGEAASHDWRTQQRSRALIWLDESALLEPGIASQLRQDSTFLGSTDPKDLYLLLRPGFTVDFRTPTDLADISRQLSASLCSFDSTLCNLEIVVVSLSGDPSSPQFQIRSRYQGKPLMTTEAWGEPASDRDFLSWLEYYPVELFMSPYNALLDSLNAPYRLYYTFPTEYDGQNERDLLILPLDSRQARAVVNPEVTRVQDRLSGPEPTTFLDPEEVSELLDSLHQLGFFDPLTEQQWSEGKQCVESHSVKGATAFFRCFPTLYADLIEGQFFSDINSNNPLPSLSSSYYFLVDPNPYRHGLYLRLQDAPATYLTRLFGNDLRKL